MGTVAFALAADAFTAIDSNTGYQVYGTITMSNSYAITTGDALPTNMGGVGNITFIDIGPGLSAGPNPTAGLYIGVGQFNSNGVLTGIRVFQCAGASSPMSEISNATNLSNLTFSVCLQKTN